jgi:two-component system cell cycle response regulator DivK
MLELAVAPARAEQGRSLRPRQARQKRLNPGGHALVVDADAGTRRLCRDVLRRCGLSVDVVDSGVAAVAMARQRRPVVIFVDLQLHDAPGLDVIGWLQSNPALKAIPIIALSAVREDIPSLRSSGARLLLQKPLSAAAVADAIWMVIGDGKRRDG